jgi:hypothetical protein
MPPNRDKNGQKSLPVQEALQGPPVQPGGALRSQGVGASDARHQAKRANGPHNGPTWPAGDPSTSKPK